MKLTAMWVCWIALLMAGCSAVRNTADGMHEQMERARTAEASGDLAGAAYEYAAAAEKFPSGELYAVAARKAAVLYAHPLNPARNDSIALAPGVGEGARSPGDCHAGTHTGSG